MQLSLSETSEAKEWLAQFDKKDVQTAKLLLDGLVLITYSELRKGFYNAFSQFLELHNDVSAVFCAREPQKNDGVFIPYWVDKEKNPEKIKASSSSGIGSEGILAELVRDLVAENSDRLLDHPSISKMKNTKCRHLIIIDDISGSGSRIISFLNWLTENPTIKSWLSYKWIDIYVICFAITDSARTKLNCNKLLKNHFMYAYFLDKNSTCYTKKELNSIKQLCNRYTASRKLAKDFAFGYKNSFALIVFNYTCPNNLPAILWQESDNWYPLFKFRHTNIDITNIKNNVFDMISINENLNLDKLKFSEEDKHLFLIMCLLKRKFFNYNYFSSYFHLSFSMLKYYLEKMKDKKFIDSNKLLTIEGKNYIHKKNRELRRIKQTWSIDDRNDLYYPYSSVGD